MNKKLRSIFFVCVLSSFLFLPTTASAHLLQSSGSVGAVLHIDPDDDPIVGVPSGFFFEFKDKNHTLTPGNCSCTFSVLENGKELYTQPLFQGETTPSLTNAGVFYTFTHRGVYQVQVHGQPAVSGTFTPFTLTYVVRVAREQPTATPGASDSLQTGIGTHTGILTGGIVVVIVLGLVWWNKRRQTSG